jgi:serine protease
MLFSNVHLLQHRSPMHLRLPLTAILALAALYAAPPSALAAEYAPGEVIVKYEDGTDRAARAAVQAASGTEHEVDLPGGARELEIEDGDSVGETLAELRTDPDVEYALPNYVARAAAFFPNDPGQGAPGQWTQLQWNFAGPHGVNAPDAWELSRNAGVGGGKGVVVAVMDTGVAYRNRGRFYRAPDLYATRFTKAYDFVDNDRFAQDENNHGTHVTGAIAQKTNNGRGATGLAYGVKIMPLRVLDAAGEGDGGGISRAIRYAARNGADIINMSLQFDVTLENSDVPQVISAIRYAHRKGVVLVAPTGNEADTAIALPSRAPHVISVGATTEHGCQADYSNGGSGIDLVAPGGGPDAPNFDNPADIARCDPARDGRDVFQETFTRRFRSFKLVGEVGTSFASPHVAATAALVIATGAAGPAPAPIDVERRIEATARDLGAAGYDTRYGSGLVDAAAAIRP